MPWIAASHAGLVAALNSDIVQEWIAADHYVRLAQFVKEMHKPSICHQIATCAAAAMSNATVLAAEVMALGGDPPAPPLPKRCTLPPAASVAEHLIDARAELAHYQGRLVFAKRLGLLRLQEVFHYIVLTKRRHLAHASVIASACMVRRK